MTYAVPTCDAFRRHCSGGPMRRHVRRPQAPTPARFHDRRYTPGPPRRAASRNTDQRRDCVLTQNIAIIGG